MNSKTLRRQVLGTVLTGGLTLQLGYRYYADGPEWGLRFQVAFLFPKS